MKEKILYLMNGNSFINCVAGFVTNSSYVGLFVEI